MPVAITDEALKEAGLSEAEARIEFACRLLDTGMPTLWTAAKLSVSGRVEFDRELGLRELAAYRPSVRDLAGDLELLDRPGTG